MSGSYSGGAYGTETNVMIFPTSKEARLSGGLICPADLPKAGALVDVKDVGTRTAKVVESRPAVQSALYGQSAGGAAQPLPSALGSPGCELVVQYRDDGTTDTISAARAPPSELDEFVDTWCLPAYLLANLLAFGGERRFSSTKREYEQLLEEHKAQREQVSAAGRPPSGQYWGASDEDDKGDQAIRVTLQFRGDGRLDGHGNDAADGPYMVTGGSWMPLSETHVQVAWREEYDEGFTSICIGTVEIATGQLDARFASSRDVSGTFKLSPKPKVF